MARPRPLLPACPLPARPPAAACSAVRSPLHRGAWGRAAPSLVPTAQRRSAGRDPCAAPALRLFCPWAGLCGCWPGKSGSARLCLHPACAGQSLAFPLPPDVPCPHLVTIRSAPCRSPFPALPALAAPSLWAGGRCHEPLCRPHAGAMARPVPAPAAARQGRSRRLGATGLFFYNNFLVHSNFFL